MATDYSRAKAADAMPLVLVIGILGVTLWGAAVQYQATIDLVLEDVFRQQRLGPRAGPWLVGIWVLTAVLLVGAIVLGRRRALWVSAWATAAVFVPFAGDASGPIPWAIMFGAGVVAWYLLARDGSAESPAP